jgi:hypothetical protein
MSDPTDPGQRNPLSSSSSHASGTSARSISIQQGQTPSATPVVQDELASSVDAPEGDAPSPEFEPQAEPGFEVHAGTTQPEVGGWSHEQQAPATEHQDASYQAEAAREIAAASEPAEPYAAYSQPAVEIYSDHNVEAVADPQDQPLMTASAEPAAFEQASASVDEPVYASAASESDDSVDDESDDSPEPVASPGTTHADAPLPEHVPLAASLPNEPASEATRELRDAARKTIEENEARQMKTLALFEQVSRRFTAAIEEAGLDAARVTFKVMEFAQAGLKNNLELAKSYTAMRSVPDLLGLHAAYITRQFELLNAQAEELREITAKFALKNAASLKPHSDQADLGNN